MPGITAASFAPDPATLSSRESWSFLWRPSSSKATLTRISATATLARAENVSPSTRAPNARARASDSFPPLEVKYPATPGNAADRWIRGREYQDLVLWEAGPRSRSDAPAELLLRGLGHHLGRPRGIPDDVHRRLFDPLKLLELPLHVLVDVRGRGTSGSGQGHADVDLAFVRLELDVVHEAEVVDVDRDLGIVALSEDADHVIFGRHVPNPRILRRAVRY